MKVGRWKVLGLAGALALGYVVSGEAAQIKVDDNTWANFGLNMKIWYKNEDKRASTDDWRKNKFSVGNAKIYFTGQVAPLFQFYGEFDQEKSTSLGEAGINLAFAKEFQVLAGKIRKSFTRAQLSSGYALLTPQGYWLDPQDGIKGIKGSALGNVDYGLMVHGDLAGGMFRYRIGIYNEDRSNATKYWEGDEDDGWTGYSAIGKFNDKKNFEWNARIEFTPTMLGFKPESAATITAKVADTYLGKKDVLTIGLGYHTETHTPKFSSTLGDLKRKGWTVDALFEKKFGNLVPNLQVGYISLDNTHYYKVFDSTGAYVGTKKGDTEVCYVQGQLLFDQVAWLGKPAIAFRYESIKADGQWTDEDSAPKKDLKTETFGLAFNYYLKGQAARISLGFDQTKYKGALKSYLKRGDSSTKKEDSITDWYLYLQSQF